MTTALNRITFKSSFGTDMSVIVAGDKQRPAILLLHGFPSSANTFRDIIPTLAESSYVIAPDLPGYGESNVLPDTSFDTYTTVISELLDHLDIGPRFIYLHDFGAVVGLRIAMNAPEQVLGLIIQNANAHRSGFDALWENSLEFFDHPTAENTAKVMSVLTLKGTRDQYVMGVPADVTKHIPPAIWEEDWRVMSLPGRLEVQRHLLTDYASHVAQFKDIGKYLRTHQPPAIMIWGRHDAFFNIAETVSWMKDLPRMEAHILDGGHFLLETHAKPATRLLRDFIKSIQ